MARAIIPSVLEIQVFRRDSDPQIVKYSAENVTDFSWRSEVTEFEQEGRNFKRITTVYKIVEEVEES
jgi:hypothetical protein